MKKMKKVMSLMLVMVLAFVIVACGNEQSAEQTVEETLVKQETEVTETETAPEVLSKVVIYNSSLATVLDSFGKSDTIVGAYGSLSEKYGVPECGKWNEVDVEAVIAAGAEAIFGYEKYTTPEQIEMFKTDPKRWVIFACYLYEYGHEPKDDDEKNNKKLLKKFIDEYLVII